MKATIHLEFTDDELSRFAEQWANRVLVQTIGTLASRVDPVAVSALSQVLLQALAAVTPLGGAPDVGPVAGVPDAGTPPSPGAVGPSPHPKDPSASG